MLRHRSRAKRIARKPQSRRREFSSFPEFADEVARERIPDPSAERTFRDSCIDWSEPDSKPYSVILALYRRLLAIRKDVIIPHLAGIKGNAARVERTGERGVTVTWTLEDGAKLMLVSNLSATPLAVRSGQRDRRLLYATHQIAEAAASLPAWFTAWYCED